jgi:predicted small lipoprotein YifL
MQYIIKSLHLCLLCALIAACGQKGPLILPEDANAQRFSETPTLLSTKEHYVAIQLQK